MFPLLRSLRGTVQVFSLPFQAVFVLLAVMAAGQSSSPSANSDPTYQALRNVTLSGESVGISNLSLKREAGTFHLRSGTVCFVAAVNGKVTGAVFSGDGNFVLEPQIVSEQNSLKLLTKESEFSESFDRMVLRFTDSTYEEIKKAGTAASGCDAGPLKAAHDPPQAERQPRDPSS